MISYFDSVNRQKCTWLSVESPLQWSYGNLIQSENTSFFLSENWTSGRIFERVPRDSLFGQLCSNSRLFFPKFSSIELVLKGCNASPLIKPLFGVKRMARWEVCILKSFSRLVMCFKSKILLVERGALWRPRCQGKQRVLMTFHKWT